MFLGIVFIILGLAIIFGHESLIRNWDYWNNGMFGQPWWTGKFTRGGKLFLWGLGAFVSIYGIVVLVYSLL